MNELLPRSIRLTEMQAKQLDYLAGLYGSQSSAFRTAIDLLYTLRKLEELGVFDRLDTDQLLKALKDPSVLPVK